MKIMKSLKIFSWSLLFSFFLLSCENAKGNFPDEGKNKKEQKKKKAEEASSSSVTVVKKWNLPEILLEVSGIAYLGNNKFACIQDEAGVIFIYDTAANKIDRTITFGTTGDYEGIAVVGEVAYIVRSDGRIYKVDNINSTSSPKVKEYNTSLTAANNVEGLTYDAKHNRLLLAIKGAETNAQDFKGVYAFDLSTKKLVAEPLFKINLTDPFLGQYKGKKLNNALQPSEIAVHPQNGNIYLTEGANPQLFVLNPQGKILARHKLDSNIFPQPEGIAFTPSGDLFISNEGQKGNGNILQVQLKN
ncbi:hypothetical protein AAE02nite_51340 [Adhaeribacter aerolatus]|uniref:SMP-30/Gluconolactonase/LRE-like region domain-containing protein n=1 Tax=Adhaeribacter aerolatus TaxID=670289 RepID=A0A512B686_9BACT|nr:hypothetical protein [Adhaeribacter aerolatus]GEO07470.1 hypothetical protein AAE02nite_51340 [Adhaeribacter aerolatus]